MTNLYLKHAVPFTFGMADIISVLVLKAEVLTVYQGKETDQSERVERFPVSYCELA